jgi:DNA-binding Xre family transcriptional regulator
MMIMNERNVGRLARSWLGLDSDGEAEVGDVKRLLARQVQTAMQQKRLTKAEMARRMQTSRAALDRLLDPNYDAVTLNTLRKAAVALGRQLRLELV